MWHLAQILAACQLWFSDGLPTEANRGGHGVTSRLIVDRLGFLDLTEIRSPESLAIDANGATLWVRRRQPVPQLRCPSLETSFQPLNLSLKIEHDGRFKLSLTNGIPNVLQKCYSVSNRVSGQLKPLPDISPEDVKFIDKMIEEDYVPYQNITDAPMKTVEEIRALGKQFFPFTPYNFQLAMCIYDWTTASFARMVFFKIFQYTGIYPLPHPLDEKSLATTIWKSNYSVYTPQDPDYMRSFLMKPANSLANLTAQLDQVIDKVYEWSEIQNRLLAAAMKSMPRTSLISKPQLFSGQVDISQLSMDHFGIEFLESPLNNGPVGVKLVQLFADVLASYVSVGKTITTKMVWSFADSLDDAMHYSNGIVLVASLPADTWVWDEGSFITPLSDDPAKIEYTFAPGTQFEVKSVDTTNVDGKPIVVIGLEPKPSKAQNGKLAMRSIAEEMAPEQMKGEEIVHLVETFTSPAEPPHSRGKTGGRRCACNDDKH